jgi:hypothetical protein
VLANVDGTSVSINGSVVATLSAGQFYEQVAAGPLHVTSSQPVLVAYFAQGQLVDLAFKGDPTMMLIPPTSEFLTSYTFESSNNFDPNFVNVVEGGGMLGYQAILKTMKLLQEAVREEKDLRGLIQIKGMGCGGCV